MIKKSVFEDDLIRGMQSELIKQAHNVEVQDLSAAADYLNSAVQILDEVGMVEASDKILNILLKVAQVPQESTLGVLLQSGFTLEDLSKIGQNDKVRSAVFETLRNEGYDDNAIIKILFQIKKYIESQQTYHPPVKKKHPKYDVTQDVSLIRGMLAGDPVATAKVNANLRDAGKNDAEIIAEIGFKNFMPEREVRRVLSSPALDITPKVYQGVEEPEISEKLYFDELEASDHKKPRNPNTISDRHTKSLTSEKMINNLKHHGTVFNMADDGFSDILNADIDDNLNVSEDDLIQIGDFEDEID